MRVLRAALTAAGDRLRSDPRLPELARRVAAGELSAEAAGRQLARAVLADG
jgi:hypothetical protein